MGIGYVTFYARKNNYGRLRPSNRDNGGNGRGEQEVEAGISRSEPGRCLQDIQMGASFF
jgi:hypothetical protein